MPCDDDGQTIPGTKPMLGEERRMIQRVTMARSGSQGIAGLGDEMPFDQD